MKYLLDTNVCVDYLTGRHPEVGRRIEKAAPEDLWLSSVVVSELRYGAEKSQKKDRNHAKVDTLVEEFHCLDYDLSAARVFGRVRIKLEAEGQPIGPYDMMIAAQALAMGLILVTNNVREFSRIEDLKIENWREETPQSEPSLVPSVFSKSRTWWRRTECLRSPHRPTVSEIAASLKAMLAYPPARK